MDVLWLVLEQGLRLTAIGLGLGFIGAVILMRLLRGLFGVSATAPLTFICVTLLLSVIAVLTPIFFQPEKPSR
jgi:putative ABC transport system permease protein